MILRHIPAAFALTVAAVANAQDATTPPSAPPTVEDTGAAQAALPQPNLLANGGFDDVNGLTPDAWDLYILPRSGARGNADPNAPLQRCH